MCKIVAYYRVSTDRQGKSGLGLEAQRQAVMDYARGHEIIAEFTEVESGKNDARPELAKAIHHVEVTNSKLVIAKLDRLSRNAEFLLKLQNSGVPFVAADMPDADNFTVGILALVAQRERETISKNTKKALAAAKARGVILGNPRTLQAGAGQKKATAKAQEIADRRKSKIRVVIADIQESGITSNKGIARELEARQIETARGKTKWTATQVKRVLET